MALAKGKHEDMAFHLSRFFRPAAPITRTDIFSGRRSQIEDVVDTINQPGSHAVLYGERGVGKTSLANMLLPTLQSPAHEVLTPIINCSESDSYQDVWRRVFGEVMSIWDNQDFEPNEDLAVLVGDLANAGSEISIDTVRETLGAIGAHYIIVVVIDEFDLLASATTRKEIAETIKVLSDRNSPCTLLLIGVADDIDHLVQDHRSIERCMKQIKMPRMRRAEISSIITNCLSQVSMSIEEDALNDLARLTRGLPHYAHLLGLHSGRAALHSGVTKIDGKYLGQGIERAVEKVLASIQTLYRRATSSTKPNATYKEVMLACSIAKTDEFGSFSAKDVEMPLTRIRKKRCAVESFARHLHAFTENDRGPALKKEIISASRYRFRFNRPLLQPYVILKSLSQGVISAEELKALQNEIEKDDEFSPCLFDL